MRKGFAKITHNAVTKAGSVKMCVTGYNALIVHHKIADAAAGGYVSLKMSNEENGYFIAHHGEGTGAKTENSKTDYTCVFKGIMDFVEVTLNYTDGTHTVMVQAVNL